MAFSRLHRFAASAAAHSEQLILLRLGQRIPSGSCSLPKPLGGITIGEGKQQQSGHEHGHRNRASGLAEHAITTIGKLRNCANEAIAMSTALTERASARPRCKGMGLAATLVAAARVRKDEQGKAAREMTSLLHLAQGMACSCNCGAPTAAKDASTLKGITSSAERKYEIGKSSWWTRGSTPTSSRLSLRASWFKWEQPKPNTALYQDRPKARQWGQGERE